MKPNILHYIPNNTAHIRHIVSRPSQVLSVYKQGTDSVLHITIDSGATVSIIIEKAAKRCGFTISRASQTACQADGYSQLQVVGEIHSTVTRDKVTMPFEALVVKQLCNAECLGGMNFIHDNEILPRPWAKTIEVKGKHQFPETNPINIEKAMPVTAIIERKQSSLSSNWNDMSRPPTFPVVVNRATILMPGEAITVRLAEGKAESECVPTAHCTVRDAQETVFATVEPRRGNVLQWPPQQVVKVVDGTVKIANTGENPIFINKNSDLAQVRLMSTKQKTNKDYLSTTPESLKKMLQEEEDIQESLAMIKIDPQSQLSSDQKTKIKQAIESHKEVFDGNLTGGYNSHSGKFVADFNFADNTRPPGSKGYFPSYSHKEELIIQAIADKYEDMGVLVDPQEAGISVQHTSPLLLVVKPSALAKPEDDRTVRDYRLVAAMNQLNDFIKATPIKRNTPDHLFQVAAKWKYIFVTDASEYFYQLWMHKSKWPYLGVQTPFKGKKVLTRAVQGLKGMSERSHEFLGKVLAEEIMERNVAQEADDILTGGETFEEALQNFQKLLQICQDNNIKLNPRKTICCPTVVDIQGWEWRSGEIHPSTHQIITLKNINPPDIKTVKHLRGFIGLYKVFFKSHPSQAGVLSPLEDMVAGKDTNDKIIWTEQQLKDFESAKEEIQNIRPRTIPKPSDLLVISKDGCLSQMSVGMIMWARRDGEWKLVECFSFKINASLKNFWACELEGFADGAAAKKFKHYILESHQDTIILTDSRPCYLAYQLLKKGKMSTSPRLNVFFATMSALPVRLEMSSAKMGQMLGSDTMSRNAVQCGNPRACQMCSFVEDTIREPVTHIRQVNNDSIADIIAGRSTMPFLDKKAILSLQQQDNDIAKAVRLITGGIQPQKNNFSMRDVKTYVTNCKVDRDGLLYKETTAPDLSVQKNPVIPKSHRNAMLVSLHLKFNHPTPAQLENLCKRTMFMLDCSKIVRNISKACVLCGATQHIKAEKPVFTSSTVPQYPGSNLGADVMKWFGDKILCVVDNETSYLNTGFVQSETKEDLTTGLVELVLPLKIGPKSLVRVDTAPGFRAIVDNRHPREYLENQGIILELGHEKNKNSLAVTDKCIRDLEQEIQKLQPEGGRVSKRNLAIATDMVNKKLRPTRNNMSAKEILTQRNQFSGDRLPVDDKSVTQQVLKKRHIDMNVGASEKTNSFPIGTLVFIKNEHDKKTAREMYLVVEQGPEHKPNTILVQKLIHVLDNKRGEIRPRKYLVKPEQLMVIPGFNNVIPVPHPTLAVPPHNKPKPAFNVPNLDANSSSKVNRKLIRHRPPSSHCRDWTFELPQERSDRYAGGTQHVDQYDSTSDEEEEMLDANGEDENLDDLLEGLRTPDPADIEGGEEGDDNPPDQPDDGGEYPDDGGEHPDDGGEHPNDGGEYGDNDGNREDEQAHDSSSESDHDGADENNLPQAVIAEDEGDNLDNNDDSDDNQELIRHLPPPEIHDQPPPQIVPQRTAAVRAAAGIRRAISGNPQIVPQIDGAYKTPPTSADVTPTDILSDPTDDEVTKAPIAATALADDELYYVDDLDWDDHPSTSELSPNIYNDMLDDAFRLSPLNLTYRPGCQCDLNRVFRFDEALPLQSTLKQTRKSSSSDDRSRKKEKKKKRDGGKPKKLAKYKFGFWKKKKKDHRNDRRGDDDEDEPPGQPC